MFTLFLMKKKKEEIISGMVRIEQKTIDDVKKYVKTTKQTVGGFFALAAAEKLEKEKK